MCTIEIHTDNFTAQDLQQIVKIHRNEINQGFLSSLGDKAIRLIFSFAAASKTGILLIAKDINSGTICGFALGSSNTAAFYQEFLTKKFLIAAIYLIPKLLSFEKIRKIMETLIYPTNSDLRELPQSELLDIAVAANYQGTGVAQQLFYTFCQMLQTQEIKSFRIGTGKNLVKAQRFYEKLGAQKVASTEVHKGEESVFYIYDLPTDQTTDQMKKTTT